MDLLAEKEDTRFAKSIMVTGVAQGIGFDDVYISPDLAICQECRKELSDPVDRRYKFPFINCTNCGPRFSIIERTPYDRKNTTMDFFTMCP